MSEKTTKKLSNWKKAYKVLNFCFGLSFGAASIAVLITYFVFFLWQPDGLLHAFEAWVMLGVSLGLIFIVICKITEVLKNDQN